jgi:hypothetical protein
MNMTPTMSNLQKVCDEMGVTLDLRYLSELQAPAGKRFSTNGCHFETLVLDCETTREYCQHALRVLRDQEQLGEWADCQEPDCEEEGCPMGDANLAAR